MQDELILFEAAEHGFALRLAHRYVTKERLESLFQVTGDVIIVDASGEEISPDESGRYPQLRHNKYIVVDEQFLNQEENAQQQQVDGIFKFIHQILDAHLSPPTNSGTILQA